MEAIQLIELLKDYDLTTILAICVVYYLMNNKISIIDKSVNCRPEGFSGRSRTRKKGSRRTPKGRRSNNNKLNQVN